MNICKEISDKRNSEHKNNECITYVDNKKGELSYYVGEDLFIFDNKSYTIVKSFKQLLTNIDELFLILDKLKSNKFTVGNNELFKITYSKNYIECLISIKCLSEKVEINAFIQFMNLLKNVFIN